MSSSILKNSENNNVSVKKSVSIKETKDLKDNKKVDATSATLTTEEFEIDDEDSWIKI